MDPIMRRIWNSPWTSLVTTLVLVWIISGERHGWSFWFDIVLANCTFYMFMERGHEKWANKSGECEVCGKNVRLDKDGGTGACLTRKGSKPRFVCMDHISQFNIVSK